jgi:uncharacterized membrane protein (UPF0182 family)
LNKDFSITRDVSPTVRSPRLGRIILLVLLGLVVVWISSGGIAYLVSETLWFSDLGYVAIFWRRILTQAVVWLVVTGLSLAFIGTNLLWTRQRQHLRDKDSRLTTPPATVNRTRSLLALGVLPETPAAVLPLSRPIAFRWLMLLVVGGSGLMSLVILYYGQAFFHLAQVVPQQANALPALPPPPRVGSLWTLVQQIWAWQNPVTPLLGGGIWIGGAIALLVYPRWLLSIVGLLLSVGFGGTWAANWSVLLLFSQQQGFNRADPLFARDIGFYLFSLPVWQLVEFWLLGLTLYTVLTTLLLYLLSGNSLSRGDFPGFSSPQQRHLLALMGCFMVVVALSYWLRRYELLYSPSGVVFGAAYTEVHVQLPFYTGLAGVAIAIALFLFWQARPHAQPRFNPPNRRRQLRKISWSLLLLVTFCLLEVASTTLIPLAVQRFVVQPNELTRELPYIRQNIALTREAFKLDGITVEPFNPQGNLTLATIQNNDPTIRNIRLWDTRPLLETNRQLQQIRPYYRFFDADIDRYSLINQPLPATSPNPGAIAPAPIKQQVLISARELDYNEVPSEAKTWVNEHLVYTHGYGFTISPVNKVAPGGLPDFFVKDIGVQETGNDGEILTGTLTTANAGIRASIPIGKPRLYFGELTNTYVMTNTQVEELDFPSGNDNIYNVYDGAGGVRIGTGWRRWIFARTLHDWQMLLTNSFTRDTRVLFRRNIKERVRAIAPFLKYDQDPYLVTADIGCLGLNLGCDPAPVTDSSPTRNYLYWILDAYTVSDHYPYSDPSSFQGNELETQPSDRFNYIRNSVKVVVDAYNGSVNFYVADPTDPIIRAWAKVFPRLLKPIEQLPASLRSHIRYPIDLFSIQSERLLIYHMTDPQVFYNREDQWQVPNEIYGSQSRPVEPYFLITNLPTKVELEEFILLLPLKPTQRTNLIAWLAARSDGDNYGKQLLYVFPKQQLVFGIEQIEARINQDPVISQQITLWNRQGSRVLQGNLLVIPIEQSLLYVEPLYLEAEQNSLPTLVGVVVAYENRIVMADTLEKALNAIFQAPTTTTPAIVRPVE